MAMLINDPLLEQELKARREASGADRYDEVWEGIYMMAPMPNDEHRQIVTDLASILKAVIGWSGLGDVRAGVNVSDRETDWRGNYRVPDVAVFLSGGSARNCGTHWVGGPDFVVEVVSSGDRTREKIPFYWGLGVSELLIIEREPWTLELLRSDENQLTSVAVATEECPNPFSSAGVPLAFDLVRGDSRPEIVVNETPGERRWIV